MANPLGAGSTAEIDHPLPLDSQLDKLAPEEALGRGRMRRSELFEMPSRHLADRHVGDSHDGIIRFLEKIRVQIEHIAWKKDGRNLPSAVSQILVPDRPPLQQEECRRDRIAFPDKHAVLPDPAHRGPAQPTDSPPGALFKLGEEFQLLEHRVSAQHPKSFERADGWGGCHDGGETHEATSPAEDRFDRRSSLDDRHHEEIRNLPYDSGRTLRLGSLSHLLMSTPVGFQASVAE